MKLFKNLLAGILVIAVIFNLTSMSAAAEAATEESGLTVVEGGENDASYTANELKYMASIIFCEAGNQSYAGKLAVGIVIKNRMDSKSFPNSITGVIYQRGQFTPARNGMLKSAMAKYNKTGFKKGSAYKECLKAAKASLSGKKCVCVGGKTKSMKGYYFFSRYVAGCKLKIGAHQFK